MSRLAESLPVGQNPSSNPKARGVRVTLKCGTREKGVQTPDAILLSLPREIVALVQKTWKSPRNVRLAKREHVQKDLSPETMETPDANSSSG